MAGLIQEFVGFEESPDYETKVNAIVDFWSNPCDAPWTIYIETLYPASGRFLLALVDTSLLDIARSYLRPRGGLTRGTNRKKGRRRGLIKGIPDTADLFARMIPGATLFEGMEYGANTKFLWQIDGIIQRGLWYWLLIDASADFFYYWAQGIQEARYCNPVNKPGIFARSDYVMATAFAGIWFPNAAWNIVWEEDGFSWFITNLSSPPGPVSFVYNATYENTGSAWAKVEVRLKGAGPSCQGSMILGPEETGTLHFGGTYSGGGRNVLEQRVLGTPWVRGRAGTWSARRV